MKQNYIEKHVEDQIQLTIRDINSESRRSANGLHPNSDLPNIFLIQNKGKGPPGRMRRSALPYCLIRDNRLVAIRASHPEPVEGSKIHFQTEFRQMKRAMRKSFLTHEDDYHGEFHQTIEKTNYKQMNFNIKHQIFNHN